MYRCYYVANNPDRIHLLLSEGVKDILVSYAYARRAAGYLEGMKTAAKKGVHLLVDSGAHSNIHHPGTVVLKEYIDWLKSNKGIAHEYIVLDDPLKRENTIKNYSEMVSKGLRPLPVDHMWFKVAPPIMPWYRKGGRMCWAGFLVGSKTPMGQWDKVSKKMPEGYATQFQTTAQWLTVAKRIHERHKHASAPPRNLIHLLGVGSKVRKFLPYLDVVDSFDAASVFIAAGYGRVMICREPRKPGFPPRCSGVAVGRGREAPPDVAKLASKWKLNLDKEVDRRRFNVREMRKYHEALWAYFQAEHKKGHDHLMEMAVRKSDEDEDEPLPFMIQVPLAIGAVYGDRLQLEQMEEVKAQARMTVSEVTPARVAELSDPSLLVLHEAAHGLVHEEAAGLPSAHLFITQEMAKRRFQHLPEDGDWLDFATLDLAKSIGLTDEEQEKLGLVVKQMVVQSLIFAKDVFKTRDQVVKWVKDHGFKVMKAEDDLLEITKPGVDETTDSWRVRQRDPGDFVPDSFRTVQISEGVKAVMGKLKETKTEKSDEPEDELLQPVLTAKLLPVEKQDGKPDLRIVLGIVLEPNSVDTQGDTIPPEEILKAAHLWLARFQDRGFMHRQIVNSKIEIYESYVAPVDLTMGGQKVKKGTWLLMYHIVDDTLWAAIKRGDLTGFSMGGFARRVKP